MTLFDEKNITGSAYRRAYNIAISHELGCAPTVNYHREQVVDIGGGEVFKRQLGVLSVLCDDMDKPIDLRNPLTGELTGETSTVGAVYALIYSHYWQSETEAEGV